MGNSCHGKTSRNAAYGSWGVMLLPIVGALPLTMQQITVIALTPVILIVTVIVIVPISRIIGRRFL